MERSNVDLERNIVRLRTLWVSRNKPNQVSLGVHNRSATITVALAGSSRDGAEVLARVEGVA